MNKMKDVPFDDIILFVLIFSKCRLMLKHVINYDDTVFSSKSNAIDIVIKFEITIESISLDIYDGFLFLL
jgi:hypothetical protein